MCSAYITLLDVTSSSPRRAARGFLHAAEEEREDVGAGEGESSSAV